MTRRAFAIAISAAAIVAATYAQAPTPPKPAPTADPYANNPDAGKSKFPLAAPAGKDSGAKDKPLAGAVNTGAIDPATWKFGPNYPAGGGAKLWNPVKAKLKAGGRVTGGTIFSATDPLTYCAMANAGYDYIWTEMQHNDRDWSQAARMWRTCPHAKAVPGARIKVVTAGTPGFTVHRHVSSGSSFGANPLEQHLGLGKADRVARVEIFWPTSGTTQLFEDIAVNQAIVITETAREYQKRSLTSIKTPK